MLPNINIQQRREIEFCFNLWKEMGGCAFCIIIYKLKEMEDIVKISCIMWILSNIFLTKINFLN